MQQNDSAPTMTVIARAGAVRAGTWAWYAAQPMPSNTAVIARAVTTAVKARPAMIAAAGIGVARRRLRMPVSRCAVTEMTRLTKAAAMMPNVMMPGTYEIE